MKASFFFAWYDMWGGAYWDRKNRILYICPIPCVGIKMEFQPYVHEKKSFHYARLIREVTKSRGDERAAKCGYDLMCGLEEGNADDRARAWKYYLKQPADGPQTDGLRNGVWVPAIFL